MPQKDYQFVTFIIIAIVVLLLAGFFILVLVVYFNQRKKKHMLEKQDMKNLFAQELLQTQLEIQEQTFKNISQEIHDNIGQSLSFIKLNNNTINIQDEEEAVRKIALSNTQLTKVIQDMRDLSRMLNTDYISETGFTRALEQQVNILQKAGAFKVLFEVNNVPVELAAQKELVLFRIVQELLNNAVKHSDANEIRICVDYQAEKLCITISDNGRGFNSTASAGGQGLRNIQNRSGLIGGSVLVESKVSEGTTATINLPYAKINSDENL